MKPTLLIIEQNAAFRFLLSTCLNKHYKHVMQHDCYSAAHALKKTDVQLLILNIEDVDTPNFDFLVHLHFSSFYADLPVIVLSNNNSDAFRRSCFELGIEAFFLKPFDPLSLLETINEVLSLNKSNLIKQGLASS